MLVPVLVALLVGAVVGRFRGGRVSEAANVRLRVSGLIAPAFILTLVPVFADLKDELDVAATLGSLSLIGVFLVVNLRGTRGLLRLGLATMAFGWTLNMVVIGANAGMPLSLAAYEVSGQHVVPTPRRGGFYRIVLADEGTVLRWLGDVLPVRPIHQVFSPGDLTLALGLGFSIVGAMNRRSTTG
jgi:hypothetical protein